MSTSDSWSDFDSLRHGIKHNTVDRLKHILSGLNEECSCIFFKSGKKQELIDRVTTQLDAWRNTNQVDKWIKAKAVLYQVRTSGMYSSSRMLGNAANSSVHPNSSAVSQSSYPSATNVKPVFQNATPGSSAIGRYDPYAIVRKTAPSNPIPANTSASKSSFMRFKPSPFFKIDQAVSQVVECPESTSASDRKQQTVHFTLTNEHISKLTLNSQKYQLRLFCTSSMFYSSGPNAFRTNASVCPVEFPPTCEVRVNNSQLTANMKGLKKKPGTAPPPDLGKAVRLSMSTPNRVEMVYVNSQQPTQPKKFYLVVMLVEASTVDQLVERLRKGKYQSAADVMAKMIKASSEDDDIVAGPQKMSLKCPLSFMRIVTPCRSSLCVHSQCFDATSWFSVMEQTTTWLCPVCEKILNYEDLIIDGYFDEILKQSPDSVEDVMVEADGQWHTSDNKYASAGWKVIHLVPPTIEAYSVPKPSPAPERISQIPKADEPGDVEQKSRGSGVEILILDSDDEDEEGRVKRELSPSFGRQSLSGRPPSGGGNVIDLTLDSEDDEAAVVRRVEKRKAAEVGPASPTEQIWKKSRTTPIPAAHRNTSGPAVGASSRSPDGPGTGYAANGTYTPLQPSVSPTQLGVQYAGPYANAVPPIYQPAYRPSGSPALGNQTLAGSYPTLPQLNGSSRWT